MVDSRNQALALVPHVLRGVPIPNTETWLGTKVNESTFSLLASQAGGRKPMISHLKGRLARLEVTAGLKRDKEAQFSVRRSKRKWKIDDTYTWGYNSGQLLDLDQDKSRWYQEVVARAYGASRNRSTVRSFNKAAGGV